MAYDLARLEQGLINADKAGDVDAARAFAAEIRKMRVQAAPAAAPSDNGTLGRESDTLQVLNPATLWNDKAQNFDTGIPLNEDWANALAGAGKSFADIGRRVGQMTGQVSEADIDAAKKLDAPLMATKAGIAGNILGSAAAFAPTALIPGANTVSGAGLIGTLMGAMQPTGTEDSTLKNAALGGLFGAGTQWGLNKAASVLGARLAKKTAQATASKVANAGTDDIVRAAQDAGYVLPPTSANPTKTNAVLESLGGKLLTEQKASLKNQDVTNALAKRALGVGDDVPLTDDLLNGIKKEAGVAYDTLKKAGTFKADQQFASDLGNAAGGYKEFITEFPELANKEVDNLLQAFSKPQMSANGLVEGVKKLRFDSGKNLRSLDPDKVALGRVQRKIASAAEDLMERNLNGRGMGDVLANFKNARTTYAKASTIQEALDESGNVSAKALAKMMDKGKPLSGELETVAKVGTTFPKAVQDVKRSMLPGSPLDWAVSGATSAMTGNPAYMALLMARPATRSLLLSRPYQSMMLGRSYTPGMMTRLAPQIASSGSVQTLARLLASATATKQ